MRRLLPCVAVVIVLAACSGGDEASPPASVGRELAAEVIGAATNSWSLLNAARLDPQDASKVDAAIAAYTAKAQDAVSERLTQYGVTGQVSRTDDEAPATVVPYPDTVEVAADGREASLTLCEVDTNILVQPGMAEGGADVVVDDEFASYRVRVTLRLVDGAWLEADGEVLETFEDATTCPDLP